MFESLRKLFEKLQFLSLDFSDCELISESFDVLLESLKKIGTLNILKLNLSMYILRIITKIDFLKGIKNLK